MMREDHGMSDEIPDWSDLTEPEWLGAWRDMYTDLEAIRAALVHPSSGMDLTPVQVAYLDGELGMLHRLLSSRGIDLEE